MKTTTTATTKHRVVCQKHNPCQNENKPPNIPRKESLSVRHSFCVNVVFMKLAATSFIAICNLEPGPVCQCRVIMKSPKHEVKGLSQHCVNKAVAFSSISLSLCLCLSVVFLSLFVSVSFSLSLSLSFCLCLSVSVCLCLSPFRVFILSLSVFVFV